MRKLLVLAILVALTTVGRAEMNSTMTDWVKELFGCSEGVCVITDNLGGTVTLYQDAAEQARQRHLEVRVDGECNSSCVVFISIVRDTTCLTEKARLGLHMGFSDRENLEARLVSAWDKETAKLFAYPPRGERKDGYFVPLPYGKDINAWARANGKMPASKNVAFLTLQEALQFFKAC